MSVCTYCPDLAQPHFLFNCVPNEEEKEKFQKLMDSKTIGVFIQKTAVYLNH